MLRIMKSYADMTEQEKQIQRDYVADYYRDFKRFSVTVTDKERKKIEKDAHEHGYKSVAQYLRSLLGLSPTPPKRKK